MRLKLFIPIASLMLIEFMAFFDKKIAFGLKMYANHTFNLVPAKAYTFFGHLLFGVAFAIVAKWMQTQKKEVPLVLMLFNIYLVMVSYRRTISYSSLGFMFIGYLLMVYFYKHLEKTQGDKEENER